MAVSVSQSLLTLMTSEQVRYWNALSVARGFSNTQRPVSFVTGVRYVSIYSVRD